MLVTTREQRLTEVFIKLADTLAEDFELAGFLGMLADATVELIQVDAVELSLTDHEPVLRVAATPERAYATSEVFPLCLRGKEIGSMSLFRVSATPLSEHDLVLGQALSDIATIGLMHERDHRGRQELCGQLQHALDSRVLIEQAKGMLAERAGLSLREAFTAMRSYARGKGCGLASVANGVLDGTLQTSALLAR
jgi:hypothetical protein